MADTTDDSARDHTASTHAHAHTEDAAPPLAFALLAAALALVVYVWTASGDPYWLDSGEFTAASIDLDIAHPPGHPLAALWGGMFAQLPLGPLAFRVALAQACAGALCVASLAQLGARVLAYLGAGPRVAGLSGCALALHFGASYALWFQSIRAEVYALQAMLVGFALERMTLCLTQRAPDVRPLYAAAFALALGLTNHHLLSFLALPALLFVLIAAYGRAGFFRRALACFGCGFVGLSGYLYLPLRAAHDLPMNLGTPRDFARVMWVVSARVYARNMGAGESEPLAVRLLDLIVILLEQLGTPLFLGSLLGAYAGLRVAHTRRLALFFLIVATLDLGARAWLGPIRGNPDILGYLLPGMLALGGLAVLGAGVLVMSALEALRWRAPPLLAALLPLLALTRFAREAAHTSLSDFAVTDELTELHLRTLPARALLVLVSPQQNFLFWSAQASERLRPDVTLLPLPFLNYPGVAEALVARDPSVADVVHGYLRAGELPRDALLALTRDRPVVVELDAREALPLAAHLLPGPSLATLRVVPPSPRELAEADARARVFSVLARAHAQSDDPETRSQLLWAHYVAALHLGSRGATQAARAHVRAALAVNPESRELVALDRALTDAHGPLDTRAFLPRDTGRLAR